MDAEWWRLSVPPELGGTVVPRSLAWAAASFILGANPAAWMFGNGPSFATVLWTLGTPEQKRFAELAVERGWGATMVLTEPDAGSDVGAGRTKAIEQPDGSWHIEGVKRFITNGDQDMTENIFHLVLARPEGAGPGTKGLSMFLVPKYLVNEDGSLGERNGARVTNLEHKMGLKVSTTCELTFGGDPARPAVGTLVGGVHDGIRQMFMVIEHARMLVGSKAIETLSTGYLNALEFAKSRVQGPDLARQFDKTSPRVTIINHPDVRRMLMQQKAYAEGLRALMLYTATQQDAVQLAAANGDQDAAAAARNDLLLPLVKGVGSERAYETLTLSLQTLGGSGFLQDYPIEQYIRDAKIDSLYEGTTAIQSLDFFFRKIGRDQGATVRRAVRGDRGLRRGRQRQRPAQGRAGRHRRGPHPGAGGAERDERLRPGLARAAGGGLQGRAHLGAVPARGRRPDHRLAARPAGRGGAARARQRRGAGRRRPRLLHGQARRRQVLRHHGAAAPGERQEDHRADHDRPHGRPRGRVLARANPGQATTARPQD